MKEIIKLNKFLNNLNSNHHKTLILVNKYKILNQTNLYTIRYEVVKVGDVIEVYVKDLDTENKKVSLGYKKAEDNPWEKFKAEYPIGSVFTAPVVSITKFGAFVRILPGIDGLVHISEISNERVEKVSDVLSVGQEVNVKLIDVDYDKKRISLSMKALLNEAPAEEAEEEGGEE